MSKPKPSPGFRWARDHALATPATLPAWQFQEQLERSQWFDTDALRANQFRHLNALVRHASANVPYYERTLAGIDFTHDLTPQTWLDLPVLTRRELQAHEAELVARTYPAEHGKAHAVTSSGSTGRPVTVQHNVLTETWHKALTFRSQLWALGRFDQKLAAIRLQRDRAARYPSGLHWDRWVDELTLPVETGPVASLDVRTSIPDQIEWLQREMPKVLVTLPSNLLALCQLADTRKAKLPRLNRILTHGEAHSDELRGLTRRVFGAEIYDSYSANEVGYIALQCPECEAYHAQSESVLVEILDEDGRPCSPGQSGRVVVTPLANYTTPLIRYEIGDYAVAGGRCRCGRSLPVIRKVLGRQRNMMVLPDGSSFWPSFGIRRWRAVAPISQAQFVQRSVSHLEVRAVSERPVTCEEEDALRKIIGKKLPMPVTIDFVYVDEIARNDSGKFEDFVCALGTTA